VRPDLFDDEHTIVPDWDLRFAAFLAHHTVAVGIVLGIVGLVLYGLVGGQG